MWNVITTRNLRWNLRSNVCLFLHRSIFMAPVLESLLSCPRNVVRSLLVLISCPTAAGVAPWTLAYWDTTAFSVMWANFLINMLPWLCDDRFSPTRFPVFFFCCQSSCLCQLNLLSCKCMQYSRHCWNYRICGFLVFDSWIFWYKFINTTILYKNLYIQQSCYFMAKC